MSRAGVLGVLGVLRVLRVLMVLGVLGVLMVLLSVRVWAQDMPGMQMPVAGNPLGIDPARDGSGTSWLPDASPAHGLMRQSGMWMLMLDGRVFVQYIKTGGARGDDQFGSINWIMSMAQRTAGGGPLQFRLMLSAEPATIGRCGYPSLLESGEFCRGAALHDRQHPHDIFMEVAADYRHAINDSIAAEVYGGPAGEPALGPTAFPHRPSAMPSPVAPISHHWLDSSHISFGVVTGAIYGRMWKAEASVFNGREPDDRRWDLDLAPLDSYSARVWLMPTAHWALQISAGHLREAEARVTPPRVDVNRITASATYQRMTNTRMWATTIAWGRNGERDQVVSHGLGSTHTTSALMAESAADLTLVDTVFGRVEVTGKTSAELALPDTIASAFTVTKVQAGYTRWLSGAHAVRAGIGGSVGLSIVPEALATFYGGRTAGEFAVFIDLRPR